MTNPNSRKLPASLAAALAFTFALAISPSPASAQTKSAPAPVPSTTTEPIVRSSKPSTKLLKFHGLVVSTTSVAITLRSDENPAQLQTFVLSPELRDRMIRIINKGGYQFNDRVTVEYKPGTDVALRLKGKPSKPVHF